MPIVAVEEVGGTRPPPGNTPRPSPRKRFFSILKYSLWWAQAVACLVLVILAAVLRSPTQPHKKQNQPTEDCPHPQLFEAWIGANLSFITTALSASAWLMIRQYRATLRQRAARAPDVERPRLGHEAAAAIRRRRRRRRAELQHQLEQPRPMPLTRVRSLPDMHSMPSARLAPRAPGSASSPALHLSPIAAMSPGPSTPGSSSSPTGSTAADASTPSLALSQLYPDLSKPEDEPTGSQPQGLALGLPAITALPPALLRPPELPTPTPAANLSTPASPRVGDSPLSSSATFGPYPAPYVTNAERRQRRRDQWVIAVDRLAHRIQPWTFTGMFILFILGHVLLFRPSPSSQHSCYKGAPLLWWGVLVPIAYVWAIVASYTLFFVLLYTIAIVITILRIAGIMDIPEWDFGASQPAPLSNVDLLQCKLVCYVPDPKEGPPSPDPDDDPDDPVELPGTPVPIGEIDLSRLPNPAVVLPPHRASCGICQENFTSPREVTGRIMYDAPSLRQLPCAHTFHCDCIDSWLLEHSGRCPYCNKSIKEMLAEKKAAEKKAATATATTAASTTALGPNDGAAPAATESASTQSSDPLPAPPSAPALQADGAAAAPATEEAAPPGSPALPGKFPKGS